MNSYTNALFLAYGVVCSESPGAGNERMYIKSIKPKKMVTKEVGNSGRRLVVV
jgi:hypothetical protein